MIVDDLFESGAFGYGARKPKKGSVADLAAQKRQEQERGRQPIEPRDQQVGTAKVTKDVAEGSDTTKFTDYDDWSDKVDALGAQKHMQKNGILIVAQTWDGDVVGEFDTRTNQGHLKNQGVAEGRENVEHFNGLDFSIEIEKDDEYVDDDDTDNQTIYVKAFANGRELGHVLFTIDYDGQGMILKPQDLEVDERFQGQGIAATMYDYVKSKGYRIRRSGQQTDAGAGFWNKHRPKQNVWEQGVAEGSAQDKLYKHHQELRKKSGLPDAEYYQELKQTYTLPDEERYAKQAEIKKRYGVKEQRTQCPECGGAAYEDQMLAEKNDACYHKVKSRYKVWPSAYASGALVRCRKVGAANWGNKSKK